MTNNDRLIRWIQRRAEGFRGDIAVIAAYGSYINGTANPRSDVDCYFVPKTERGGKFAATFILAGVGYDIFPMNWARLERIADLRDSLTPLGATCACSTATRRRTWSGSGGSSRHCGTT